MRILSPEQAYFAQEAASEEQQRVQYSLYLVEKSQAFTLKAITAYLQSLRAVIDAESNEGGNGTTVTDEDWKSTLNMAHDLVHELGYDQVRVIKERAGI
jgi:hypothetical protein